MEVIQERIPGTSRQRIRTHDGRELQRQSVYMEEEAWEALRDLSLNKRTSGSVIITRLIWEAHKRYLAKRQTTT